MSQSSIEDLRIYKLARELEDQVYELVKAFPPEQFYAMGNDLRRASAGVSHHIMNTHQFFSYTLKLDELAAARRQAGPGARRCGTGPHRDRRAVGADRPR